MTDSNGHGRYQTEKVRVAIVGVGNCASAFVQGVHYYKDADPAERVPGLMHVDLGGYHVSDIEFTAAFDIDSEKVGKDLSEAIWSGQNNTIKFSDVPELGVKVQRGTEETRAGVVSVDEDRAIEVEREAPHRLPIDGAGHRVDVDFAFVVAVELRLRVPREHLEADVDLAVSGDGIASQRQRRFEVARVLLEDRLAGGVLAVLADHIDAVAIERVVDRGFGQHRDVGLGRQHHSGVDEHAR